MPALGHEPDFGGSWARRWLLAARVAISIVLSTWTFAMPGSADWQVRLRTPPGKWFRFKCNVRPSLVVETTLPSMLPLIGKVLVKALFTCRKSELQSSRG